MTNDSGLVWDGMSLSAGQRLVSEAVESCEGLMWVKTSETRVGIAVNLPGDMPIFDPGKAYKNLEFETIYLYGGSEGPKIFGVFCIDSAYFEIFEDLCRSLVKALKQIDSPIAKAKTTVTRAKAWSELFKSGRKEMTREKVMGLMCELFFLEDHWFTLGRGVSSWFGPDYKSQDFVDSDSSLAVEVKLQSQELVVSISSIYQLDYEGTLFLFAIQLEEHGDGVGLNELVDRISASLNPYDNAEFQSKLLRIGYEPRSSYDVPFKVKEEKCYEIVEGFPRLINGSLAGLTRVQYALELTEQFDTYLRDISEIGDALEC